MKDIFFLLKKLTRLHLDSIVTKENIKEHNPNWLQIPDHPYRLLIVGSSGSGKTNSLVNLKSHQTDLDKMYLHAKDPYEAKYELLINKWLSTGLKHVNDYIVFIDYLNNIDVIYKKIEK